MDLGSLQLAIESVPAGGWAVGVSGGADSVGLLRLLHTRGDLSLHVVHLDHQTRGAASAGDAEFVERLAGGLGLTCTVARREDVEREMTEISANASARYRAARIALFRRVVASHGLEGVILAHHGDDQAETVLQRLIRGSGPGGLAGMSRRTRLGGLVVLRPLLAVRRDDLRAYLRALGHAWREDASNASNKYLRNRLRRWLGDEAGLHDALMELSRACRAVRDWTSRAAPRLGETFAAGELATLPDVLAHELARAWLVARGAPPGELSEAVLGRLVAMARDAASPPRAHFPGAVLVCRRGGRLAAG